MQTDLKPVRLQFPENEAFAVLFVRRWGAEFQKVDGQSLNDRVADWFRQEHNGKTINSELGDVLLDRTGVKNSWSHGHGKFKAAACAAVPEVIANGRIIDRQPINIAGMHRYWVPFPYQGQIVLAKLTVKEFARESEGRRIYSVEAVDVVKPAGNWVPSISEERRNYTPQAGFEEKLQWEIVDFKGAFLQSSPASESRMAPPPRLRPCRTTKNPMPTRPSGKQ